ncbi:hypothetical protein CHARACLAT_017660 [Characodon lateralis]|uniref:Uncharacterized protein n=1 Tax=Characodon lateralis TaxID=208331 RepID=A0ABU7CP39_9TELE|nr:hypothetical protein [Characodon lateralis]
MVILGKFLLPCPGCDGQPWSSSSFCIPPNTHLPVHPLAPSGLPHIASGRKSNGVSIPRHARTNGQPLSSQACGF